MSSLEVNKIAGAGLLAGLLALVSGILANNLVQPDTAQHAAVAVPEAEVDTAPAAPEQPLPILLASASAEAGQAVAKRCASCHTFEQGGANKVGPNLFGVVGAPHGHVEGFDYSEAITSIEGPWTYEDLNAFIASPKDYAPGTKMTFAGIKDAQDRADLLAYLQTLSTAPVPFPEPTAEDQAAAAAAEAPAEATPAAAEGEAAPAEGAAADGTAADGAQAEAGAGETQTAAADAGGGVEALLAAADPAQGEGLAKRCAACHTFDQGGAAKVGPNLWDIVGAPHGHMEGYAYSEAIAGMPGNWDYAALDAFLAAPREYAPGTKMTFAGIKKPEDRADLIAWLRTLSDSPQPLP